MNTSAIDIHFCSFVKSILHKFFKSLKSINNLSHLYFLHMYIPYGTCFLVTYIYTYEGVRAYPRR